MITSCLPVTAHQAVHLMFSYEAGDGGDINSRATAVLPGEGWCTCNLTLLRKENSIFPGLRKNARETCRITLEGFKLMNFS